MKFILPSRRLLLVIFLVALINPIHYALLFFFPPENTVFLGYQDDNLMLTIMKSYQWNFDDPWSPDGGKVWHNPLIGAIFFYILLGSVPFFLKIDFYLAFIFFKFLFSLFYYIVAYNLIAAFLKSRRERNIALLIFMFAAGLGGIIYIISSIAFPQNQYLSIIGYALTNEFNELAAVSHSLTHTFRLYYMVPEALGYLSLLFYISKKKILAGLFLGLVYLFYPTYGIGFSLAILIYELLKSGFHVKHITNLLKNIIPVYFLAGLFTIPWLVAAAQRPYYYTTSSLVFEDLSTISILIGSLLSLIFALYYLKRRSLVPKINVLLPVALVTILFILKQFYYVSLRSTLFESWLADINMMNVVVLLSNYSLLLDILMAALAIFAFLCIAEARIDDKYKFLISWLIIFIVLSGIYPESVLRLMYTGRQAALLLFPMSVLATLGVAEFSRHFKKNAFFVVGIIIILSVPSILGYNYWLQKSVRESGVSAFFSQDEYNALKILRGQEDGNVISSMRFGSFIPYHTGKKSMLFSGRAYPGYLSDVIADYERFYAGNDEDRMEVIRKYEIKYVLFSEDLTVVNFDPDAADYLENIYDSKARIYKVIL